MRTQSQEKYKEKFSELDSIPFNINALSALKPQWTNGNSDSYLDYGRREDMLFYMIHGRRDYYFYQNELSFSIEDGDILFLPSGSRYLSTCTCQPNELSSGICIKLSLVNEQQKALCLGDRPFLLAHDDSNHFIIIFEKTLAAILQGVGGQTKAKACVYSLISDLISTINYESFSLNAFAEIYPAILVIEQRPHENMEIEALAQLCHMSESSFRRRFKQYANCPPHEYRNQLRINKVDELLETGLYTVERVALALGFTDASHLCKVYKKIKGHSPKYKNSNHARSNL